MATKVIGDYTAAVTIDGATHFMLIQPGSSSTAYKKISRNILLGVTGQPMDISTSQNVTNKTLDNTNILTIRDDRFTLQDNVDPTKQAVFQLSGITGATTRTYTLPNASSTLADIATAQTLTNKTLTAPVINNGSITGTTITTDAIVGQSSANSGTVYGLAITSAKLSGASITNATIPTAAIADSAVTPAKLLTGTGSSWVWQAYSPTSVGITLGSGTLAGAYIQIGKTVFYHIRLVMGAGSAITSSPTFTLPVTASSFFPTANSGPFGVAEFLDSATANYTGYARRNSTTVIGVLVLGTNGVNTAVSSTVPFTFGSADEILVQGYYEAA